MLSQQTLSIVDGLNNMIDSLMNSPDNSPSSSSSSAKSKLSDKRSTYKLRKNKSAYLFFSCEVREGYKQRGLPVGSNEMMKTISDLWKALSKQEKVKYDVMAQEDKQRYLQEKEQLMKINPALITKNKTKNNHVKRPCSAYDLFMKEMHPRVKAANPTLYSADVIKIVSREWKTLSESQRAIYQEKAKIDKQEKQSQLQALELRRRIEDSQASLSESEEEFTPASRKHFKADTTPFINHSNNLGFESFSDAVNHFEPAVQTEVYQTQSEQPAEDVCDDTFIDLGLSKMPSFNLALSKVPSFNLDFPKMPSCNPDLSKIPSFNLDLLKMPSFNLRLSQIPSLNMGLSKMPSFRFGCTDLDLEDPFSVYSH